MVHKKLLDYVKANLEKGYPIESIRKALEKNGWPIPEIDEAVSIVQGKPQKSKPSSKPTPPISTVESPWPH